MNSLFKSDNILTKKNITPITDDIKNLYKTYINSIRMLKELRGYNDTPKLISIDEFINTFEEYLYEYEGINKIKQKLNYTVYKTEKKINTGLRVHFLCFSELKTISINKDILIEAYKDVQKEDSIKYILVISKYPLTSKASSTVSIFNNEFSKKMLYFHENELIHFAPDHVFVPKHRIATKDEKNELKNIFNFNNDKDFARYFPLISPNDPIVKLFGASVGDVMIIERYSNFIDMEEVKEKYKDDKNYKNTIETQIYYRFVFSNSANIDNL